MIPPLKILTDTKKLVIIKLLTGKTQILKRQGKINNQKNQRKKGKQKERKRKRVSCFLFGYAVENGEKKESLAGNSLVCFL